ncbi:UDP-glycosyltransferase 73C6 [Hordeum vulgare]|nr:UDP-glycosyltransferase 73C6 [Hordeum vulgare]
MRGGTKASGGALSTVTTLGDATDDILAASSGMPTASNGVPAASSNGTTANGKATLPMVVLPNEAEEEGIQHCTKLVQRRDEDNQEGEDQERKIFTLPHCYEVLKDDEKWKKREDLDDLHLSNKRKRTIELNDDEEEDDASSDEGKRSPTPNSVSYSKPKRPDGARRTKPKRRRGKEMMSSQMLWKLL